ncbi:MAG: kinase [Candidatus Omnitrophica bacterium CG11_big_fil_rev_8_21_14_0_20_43_6]|nr:MAG: kinase [Candidatus Omnitrophica bacterium CG11_big_fil_rev_8_21_14_0_20_43_6]
MIISKTPFRISFFGGGTDYPAWFEKFGGAVLSTTIDKYCYISIRYLPPFFDHKHRIVYSIVENVKSTKEIKHPVVKAILKHFKIDKGVEVHHDGDLPARSGLGSSSSFTVGMLNSIYALKGKIISKSQLAKEAIHIERDVLKENVGSQDQVAVAYGGFNKIIFHNDHDFRVEAVTLHKEKIKQLQNHLMLVFTGFSRFASEIAAEQIKNTPNKEKELNVMRSMVDNAVEILNSDTNFVEFGRLLNESWLVKKKLSSKVSNSQVDSLYNKALKHGAIGGKLLGAGGGGFMLLFVRPQDRQKLARGLKGFLEVKFKFEKEGSQIIYYNPQEV